MKIIITKPALNIVLRSALLFILLFGLNNAFAQSNRWDVILLNSAEVVRGTITDSIPGQSVTILAGDSLSRTIPKSGIHLITTEVRRVMYTSTQAKQTHKVSYDSSAYYQGVLSGGGGVGLDSPNGIRMSFVNGFGFIGLVSFGFGFGLRMPLDREVTVVPLFADFRIRFTRKPIAPLVVIGIGKTLQPSEKWEGTGPIVIAEAGIAINKTGKSSVMITVGYESYDILNPIESHPIVTNNYGSVPQISMSPSTERENIRSVTLNLSIAF